jgi:hypothetical protein
MNLLPKKLVAAHEMLLAMLADGPKPVADCIAAAHAAGLSQRTLYEARRRMPVVCVDRELMGPGCWLLVDNRITAPQEWKPRRLRYCTGCGAPLVAAYWLRRRCPPCKRKFQAAQARYKKNRA